MVVVVVFYLTDGFSFHCFSTLFLTLPWTVTGFLNPFYTFSPAHRRVIRDTFIDSSQGDSSTLFYAFSSRVLRNFERPFLPQAFFTLHSLPTF